ncbi:MAG: hypothetical protein RBR18_06105 [Desulfovibrionaceae bacterium]|nr:hypothetical protein [Desulfovibrionaceae bacterium]
MLFDVADDVRRRVAEAMADIFFHLVHLPALAAPCPEEPRQRRRAYIICEALFKSIKDAVEPYGVSLVALLKDLAAAMERETQRQ